MKPIPHRWALRRAFDFGTPVTATLLLLAALTLRADTPYTASGWVIEQPLPGIWALNGLGQMILRGNAHVVRVMSDDPRLTGRRYVFLNGDAQSETSALLHGTEYFEVGTWDPTWTVFTPSGGIWQTSFRGVLQPDFSLQLHIVGYGCGGAIDGLRLDETLTRGPASAPVDLAVPYEYAGTLKPPPLNTVELVNDFSGSFTFPIYGSGTCFNSDGQFYAVGNFPPTVSNPYLLGQQCATPWTVTNGTTREWRADLVSLNDDATNMAALAVSAQYAPGYSFFKGRNFAFLLKWSLRNDYSVLWCDQTPVPLPHTNVIMAVALTRQDPNVVITTRVLDKADPNKVLFAHSYRDTPASDPSLTTSQFQALSGVRIRDLYPDAAEPPPTLVGVLLGLRQFTDGHQPVPTAVFDNLEMRTSEIPPIGIESALRVSWPASAAIKYSVQGAPTVLGPWQPAEDLARPGFDQMTVPMGRPAQFFRLIQAP